MSIVSRNDFEQLKQRKKSELLRHVGEEVGLLVLIKKGSRNRVSFIRLHARITLLWLNLVHL